jgi:hypothetical protein
MTSLLVFAMDGTSSESALVVYSCAQLLLKRSPFLGNTIYALTRGIYNEVKAKQIHQQFSESWWPLACFTAAISLVKEKEPTDSRLLKIKLKDFESVLKNPGDFENFGLKEELICLAPITSIFDPEEAFTQIKKRKPTDEDLKTLHEMEKTIVDNVNMTEQALKLIVHIHKFNDLFPIKIDCN